MSSEPQSKPGKMMVKGQSHLKMGAAAFVIIYIGLGRLEDVMPCSR